MSRSIFVQVMNIFTTGGYYGVRTSHPWEQGLWGHHGDNSTQVGPMLATWTLLSEICLKGNEFAKVIYMPLTSIFL